MGMKIARRVLLVAVTGLLLATTLTADAKKALQEGEGRRKAAETGVSQIKQRNATSPDLEAAYTAAAEAQNAWLAATTSSESTPADLAPLVERAATTLLAWVNVRNPALSLAPLTGLAADAVKKNVVDGLLELGTASRSDLQKANANRRASIVRDLETRLRWKPWAEIR